MSADRPKWPEKRKEKKQHEERTVDLDRRGDSRLG